MTLSRNAPKKRASPKDEPIRRMVKRIVRRFAPDKIILFGSYARGEAGPDSDVDLLIVMPVSGSIRQMAVEIGVALHDIRVPKDVIVTTPEEAFHRNQLLDYADHCLRKCDETFKRLSDERALERCGFWWYELNVGEFLLNNVRHAQHHAGQLALILRRRAGIGIDWLGTKDNQPPPPTW